ncbi:hypothetical protein DCAR_0100598 [Daucus carota subsp. sativus]|uniref:Uncharacterized protein n=1 Tax=Daucus carota subsp. sativus TaxID=79200 RepID=A0A166FSM1_DAUCS|nr:PREDICTED: uncharacterized protein LOC108199526 [Daucus carota subsp. sativus]XP_017222867.1 PREDICTED: uncharacterized protein LOC108199526 [Daucus carota subsp. sativus]XP_017222875.1 PREDICTED: uncharacterized protein LOC108199526 [Daucus carota subsp. sativus]WOG81451.1 hypothetical protein DCAR_0100598 [Daucus carota subsp. sativus]
MASKLSQLQSTATQATKFVAKNGPVYYKKLLEKNKHYIQDPPTIESCQLLAKQLFYTRLASIPSRYDAFWNELGSMKEVWKMRKQFTTDDYGIAALFGVECYAWFYAGEVIGRGYTFTGYYV